LKDNLYDVNQSNEILVATVERLEEDNYEKSNIIEEKTIQLNTAYYVFGTRRDLLNQEIIDRQGGLLGMGKTTVIKPNIDPNHFYQVDITLVDTVEVPSAKVQLVSTHPNDSYTVHTTADKFSQIIIENPAKFWSNTRYMVVSID
jgi:hypothetical protein